VSEKTDIEVSLDDFTLVNKESGTEFNAAERKRLLEEEDRPIVWTLAGSDSGGGAGIQADLKTFQTLGVHGCSITSSITAQNSAGVDGVFPSGVDVVRAQWESLMDDMPPTALKIGMPGDRETIQWLGDTLTMTEIFTVIDPVLKSGTGTPLQSQEDLDLFRHHLMPCAGILTPNWPEAAALSGMEIHTKADVEAAAETLCKYGVRSVLIKGGHMENAPDDAVYDYWSNGTQSAWFRSARIHTPHHHGTGCVLSSAIAAYHAHDYHELDTLVLARAYLQQGLIQSYSTGSGSGTLGLNETPSRTDILPELLDDQNDCRVTGDFAPLDTPAMGLYPIVDSAEKLERLLKLGLCTLQLRIKNREHPRLEEAIQQCISAGKKYKAQVFINDHWELALKHGAYGIHIGQDDIEHVDLQQVRDAGLRLGISTHSFTEAARALSCHPSYIAVGTIYPTDSKNMDYPALGVKAFGLIRKLLPVPVVAIGGIHLDNAEALRQCGADGFGVISEISKAEDPAKVIEDWGKFLS
jgi:hydroxymethylpyrimidine kinase/phosphomethylpyrimidine kinase/thiamine-phosphate diphosphorylase